MTSKTPDPKKRKRTVRGTDQSDGEVTTVKPNKEKVFSDMKALISDYEITAAGQEKKLKKKESTIKELQGDNKSLEKQVEDFESKVQDLEGKVNDLKAQVHEKEMERQELEQTLANIRSSEQNLEAKNKELESTLTEQNHTILALQQQVQQVKQDSKDLTFSHKIKCAEILFGHSATNVGCGEEKKQMTLLLGSQLAQVILHGQLQTQNEGASSSSQNLTQAHPYQNLGQNSTYSPTLQSYMIDSPEYRPAQNHNEKQ